MALYCDISLKETRRTILGQSSAFRPHNLMLEDMDALRKATGETLPHMIIHLAAHAGLRYSLEDPRSYVDSNLAGTFNVMELARTLEVKHFLLASTIPPMAPTR